MRHSRVGDRFRQSGAGLQFLENRRQPSGGQEGAGDQNLGGMDILVGRVDRERVGPSTLQVACTRDVHCR
jgi:hypothetical protein